MSIINDALKKAQEQNTRFKSKGISSYSVAKQHKPQSYIQKKVIAFISTLFLMTLTLGVSWLIIGTIKNLSMPPVAVVPEIHEPPEDQINTEPQDPSPIADVANKGILYQKAKPVSETFVLSGIVFGDGNPFAVINDKIVEEGDRIDEAKVVRIEKNRVTLHLEGEKITLTLK